MTGVGRRRLTFGMLITEGALAHIGQLDGSLGAGVHEPVAALRVELGGGDDFSQFLHVCGLDVDDVEALVLNIQVPEVDTQVVAADEGLAIAVDGYAVDVVGVGIGVGATRNGGDDSVVVCEAGQFEVTGILERGLRRGSRGAAAACNVTWCKVLRQVVFGDDLERLLKNLPQFDRLVVGREQVVGGILPSAPLDFVDLLLDLQRLEVVELGLVGLELGVELILARFLLQRRSAGPTTAGWSRE